MEQHDLYSLLPGVAGGRALVAQRGRRHLVEMGTTGGRTTALRYGREYMRELAARGGRAKRHKQYTMPATITAWDGVTYRRVPYWPARRRRKRPVFVRIEL